MTSPSTEYLTKEEHLCAAIRAHDSDECLMWPFYVDRDGYGRLPYRDNGKKLKVAAHRLAFKIVHGRWPVPNGLHKCDTPGCFNPRHIYEGTIQDNHDDQIARGRIMRGTQFPQAKLTEEIVAEARREYRETSLGVYRLARKYGVSMPAMKAALEGVTNWRHVPNPVIHAGAKKREELSHCGKGHSLTPENVYVYGDSRYCKQCTADRCRARRERLKAASK